MRVATKESGKTLKQWQKEYMTPINMGTGEMLWSNQWCSVKAVYFKADQVRPMTDDEKKEYKKFINAKNRKYKDKIKMELNKAMEENIKLRALHNKFYSVIGSEQPKNISKTICLDLETTGLDSKEDEILQISIIDDEYNVLLNEYVKPYFHDSWKKAESINHISPKMVENAPDIIMLLPKIKGIIENAKCIVTYNGENFDLDFLSKYGVDLSKAISIDVMLDYAEIAGEWSEYHEGYKWHKLVDCAAHYGYVFNAHDSLEDAKATLYCYKKMQEIE